MSRLTRDGTAEPVSRDQILRHARGQGNVHFPSSADHEQDWLPYPVDPYSAIGEDHIYIHTYSREERGRWRQGPRCLRCSKLRRIGGLGALIMTPRRSIGCGACIPELTTRRHRGRSITMFWSSFKSIDSSRKITRMPLYSDVKTTTA